VWKGFWRPRDLVKSLWVPPIKTQNRLDSDRPSRGRQFGEANVQLTFQENEKLVIDGVHCVIVEPDIDYQDLGVHAIFEVIPNALIHSLTDPVEVYVLRWIAGPTQGVPEFAPLYTVTT
jgi:hypothetical protein